MSIIIRSSALLQQQSHALVSVQALIFQKNTSQRNSWLTTLTPSFLKLFIISCGQKVAPVARRLNTCRRRPASPN
jgi:hypothetical protein